MMEDKGEKMIAKLYRKQKRAIGTSFGGPSFELKPTEYYQTDWYFEEDKTNEELIAELKQANNISDGSWCIYKVVERFVDAGTVNLRKDVNQSPEKKSTWDIAVEASEKMAKYMHELEDEENDEK